MSARCQDAFLDDIDLGSNIACNQALKENVFMMIVCIELRIPLFLIGKPGSSKSLAKTIVAKAMQGKSSGRQLFNRLKSVLFHSRFTCICFIFQGFATVRLFFIRLLIKHIGLDDKLVPKLLSKSYFSPIVIK